MVNVRFVALVDAPNEAGETQLKIASGIILEAPSVEAVREKLEEAQAMVMDIREATDEEVAAGRSIDKEE